VRIITLNVNGIRSAHRRGFFRWMKRQRPDVVCLQETRARHGELDAAIVSVPGYSAHFHDAEARGYSGVAIYARTAPDRVIAGMGDPVFDGEGRFLQADFGRLSVVSLYLPSGSSGEERQSVKFAFMDRLLPLLKRLRRRRREFIICGDWNIAHRRIDIENWRGNQKNSGFLPEEREWIGRVFDELGYIDAFRVVNQEPRQYTWWSNRGRAWEKNVGWRIDYQVITPGLRAAVRSASIYKVRRFSDHAPLTIDYDI
jgi:exodeoxyribonuclease-3